MKYCLGFLIVLLLFVMFQVHITNPAVLYRRPTLREQHLGRSMRKMASPRPIRRNANGVVLDDRKRNILNIVQILDPLLGTPITIQSIVMEVLKFPIKQSLISFRWTNEHIIRKLIQAATRRMNNFYDTYLDNNDLPVVVAIAAFILGTVADSFTKTDEVIEILDNFFNDILQLIVE